MKPISLAPSSETPTENRMGPIDTKRGWKLDLCLSLTGLVFTLVVVVGAVTDARNVVLLPALAFSVPLVVFPWMEYIEDERDGSSPFVAWTSRLDLAASTASFLSALIASVGLVIADARWSRDVAGFQPTMWPTDAFHFVSLSFVSALVCRRAPNEWYELFGIVLGVVASLLALLTVKSFTDEWYVGSTFVDRVYGGTTEPFPGIQRITHASTANREAFFVRFGCAIACTVCELLATVARTVRFTMSRCGREDKSGKALSAVDWRKLIPFDDAYFQTKPSWTCAATVTSKLISWIVVLSLGLVCLLTFSPYPRWIMYDSRHVATMAALAYFATPQGVTSRSESFVAMCLLLVGVVFSTWATIRTFDAVLITLSNTAGSSDALRLWSRADYDYEFVQGSASFRGVYQYAGYDYAVVPPWFAATSVLTHALDLGVCAVGAGILTSVGSDWVRAFGPGLVSEFTNLPGVHGLLPSRKQHGGRRAE